MKKKSLRKGRATRNYDKKKTKKTHPSVNSINGFPRTQQDDISRQSSLLDPEEPGHLPIGSGGSYNSNLSEEEFKSSIGSRGNFEKLIEYKNSAKTPIKRRGSTVSNFAHFKPIQNNEFWLQPVSNTEKFPVPVTVEIDRFMLNYLEQPEIISSRSTATVQDEKDDSETSQTLSQDSSSSNQSSFTSSSESEEEKDNGDGQDDDENKIQDQEPRRTPPNFKITEFDDEENQKIPISQNENLEDDQNLNDDNENNNFAGTFERKSSSDSNQRDRLFDSAKADLEIIEEDEDAEANTRGDLDSRSVKRRPLKTGTITNGKGYSLFRKKPSFEDESNKAPSIQIPSQTENIVALSDPSAGESLTQVKKDNPSIALDEKLQKEQEQEENPPADS